MSEESLTPEYGEEELIHDREYWIDENARGLLPLWEDTCEAEVKELQEAEMELTHRR